MNNPRNVEPMDPSTQLGKDPPQQGLIHALVIARLLEQFKELAAREVFEHKTVVLGCPE